MPTGSNAKIPMAKPPKNISKTISQNLLNPIKTNKHIGNKV